MKSLPSSKITYGLDIGAVDVMKFSNRKITVLMGKIKHVIGPS